MAQAPLLVNLWFTDLQTSLRIALLGLPPAIILEQAALLVQARVEIPVFM